MADRGRQLAASANEILLDETLRRAVVLERLKKGEAREIARLLNRDVIPDVKGRLIARLERMRSRGFDPGPWRTKRYQAVLEAIRESSLAITAAAAPQLNGSLEALMLVEPEWTLTTIRSAIPEPIEVRLSWSQPSRATLRSIVTSRPMHGELLSGWWDRVGRGTRNRLTQALNIGIVQGDSSVAIARRWGVELGKTTRQAEALTRTAMAHVSAHAREETFKANDDVVKRVQWVSTLDSRTTDICMSLDGQVFDIGGGPRPPAHFQCRSTIVPVLATWEELGIPGLRELPDGTRASMNGQVPAKTTYGEWLRRQPRSVQVDALGKGRAELFREGKLDVRQLVDADLKPLTLAELRDRVS